MSRINCMRKGCVDVFNAFLVSVAQYAGLFEFPSIREVFSWFAMNLTSMTDLLRKFWIVLSGQPDYKVSGAYVFGFDKPIMTLHKRIYMLI